MNMRPYNHQDNREELPMQDSVHYYQLYNEQRPCDRNIEGFFIFVRCQGGKEARKRAALVKELNMEFYRQCRFRSGNTETVAWIEERGAKVGYFVTFEDDDQEGRLWEVLSVGQRIPKDVVFDRERDYMKQRKASDIKSGSRERF